MCIRRAAVLLTADEAVHLRRADAVPVDVAVFEEAPQLQAGQQEAAARGGGPAESAVEAVRRPQLRRSPQHRELHLFARESEHQSNDN